jgi:hypothetical protein
MQKECDGKAGRGKKHDRYQHPDNKAVFLAHLTCLIAVAPLATGNVTQTCLPPRFRRCHATGLGGLMRVHKGNVRRIGLGRDRGTTGTITAGRKARRHLLGE